MKKSLYAKYIKEREGKEIIELENGFATYRFLNEHVYIEDIFVEKEHRKDHLAASMADIIADIARKRNYSKILGSTCLNAQNPTISLKVLLSYGFKLHSIDEQNNMIYLEKNI